MIFQIKSSKESISSEIKGTEAEIIYALVKIMKADDGVKKLIEKSLRAYDFVEKHHTEDEVKEDSECASECGCDGEKNPGDKADEVEVNQVTLSKEEAQAVKKAIGSVLATIFPKCEECGEHHPQ